MVPMDGWMDLRLVCSCSALETRFLKLSMRIVVLVLLPVLVWNSVVSVATDDR